MTVLIILVTLLLVALGFLLYIFDIAFYNPPRKRHKKLKMDMEQYYALSDRIKEPSRQVKQTEYEKVTITSFDGLKLTGKYYHFKDDAPVDIIFHGYRSDSENDCGGGFILSRDYGHNVLLPDQRSHSESQGNIITFGVKERYDCLYWTEYIAKRFNDVKIIISGVSMGAATVLMASDLELPNVKGIIADCGYSRPIDIILEEGKRMGIPPKIAAPLITLAAKMLGRFNINEKSAINAVKNAKVPVLIIHGEEDRLVPVSMAHKIFDACNSPKKLLTVKEAGHGLSFIIDEQGYKKAVNDFKTAVLSDNLSFFE